MVHAESTSRRELSDTKGLRETIDMYGKKIFTNKSMDLYRKWIEDRILLATEEGYHCEFLDATEGGVRIQGMQPVRLSDYIV